MPADHDERRHEKPHRRAGDSRQAGDEPPNVVSYEQLARCGGEVWIRNGGQLYRLQQTRQKKLILTK